jgi:phospholipid/cholesterol/gamma-HCH transport system substrate-binding protein
MRTKSIDNIKLGSFVLAGIVFLIFSLYMIGKNRSLFGSTFTISADFHSVNGLMPGNNVRFAGIDVGTVKRIDITSDTTVRVYMILDKDVRKYIKKNAMASVGTDGLMGNKLINVNSVHQPAAPVEEGDVIASLKPIETDEMLRTLNTTNENLAFFSSDLKRITQRINSSKGIWSLLSDTVITKNIEGAAKNINRAGLRAAEAGEQITELLQNIKRGGGLASAILTDTALSRKLRMAVSNIQLMAERTAQMTNTLNEMVKNVKKGEGTAGVILRDTVLENKLKQTATNLQEGTARFSEDMEALKSNFLFRSYFKKQEKLKRTKKDAKK